MSAHCNSKKIIKDSRGRIASGVLSFKASILTAEHAAIAALVKGRVVGVEVFRVEAILRYAVRVAEITLSNRCEA